jgi:hypothetical protein
MLRSAALVSWLAACRHEPAPKLRIEVTFLGDADLGRLSRAAEVEYTSRRETGFIFRRHETQHNELPVSVEGNRLLLFVPKYNDDEYDLSYVRVPFATDTDRRLGTAVSALSFIPYPEKWVPPAWPEDVDSGQLHSLAFYYEISDGVFRTRRYFLGEYMNLGGPNWSSVYFSTLENTRELQLTIDFRPLPYFEDMQPDPDAELAPGLSPSPSEPNSQTRALRFEVADFTTLNGARMDVAAVDPNAKLPFWDGQRVYPFAADWSIMRATDFTALQSSRVHQRAAPEIITQTWSKSANDVRRPAAGRGQIAWRYLEGEQQTSFVVGVEYRGLMFVRRAH